MLVLILTEKRMEYKYELIASHIYAICLVIQKKPMMLCLKLFERVQTYLQSSNSLDLSIKSSIKNKFYPKLSDTVEIRPNLVTLKY